MGGGSDQRWRRGGYPSVVVRSFVSPWNHQYQYVIAVVVMKMNNIQAVENKQYRSYQPLHRSITLSQPLTPLSQIQTHLDPPHTDFHPLQQLLQTSRHIPRIRHQPHHPPVPLFQFFIKLLRIQTRNKGE
jgi:hypothetical protein